MGQKLSCAEEIQATVTKWGQKYRVDFTPVVEDANSSTTREHSCSDLYLALRLSEQYFEKLHVETVRLDATMRILEQYYKTYASHTQDDSTKLIFFFEESYEILHKRIPSMQKLLVEAVVQRKFHPDQRAQYEQMNIEGFTEQVEEFLRDASLTRRR